MIADLFIKRPKFAIVIAILMMLAGGICLRYVLLLAAVRFNLVGMTPLPFWL